MTDDHDLNQRLADLIGDGLTFSDCMAAFTKRQGPLQNGLIDTAMEHHLIEGGILEVDSDAVVSTDEDEIEDGGGGYVLAWLWVDNN